MEFENLIFNHKNSPVGTLIKNKQFINYLTRSINFYYSVKGNNDLTFPAPQPVSIEKKDFEKLQKYKYYTSVKLDGVRFLMFFIKDKNNINQCIIVNRALNYYIIKINAEENLYNGTLLDGEIIFNNTNNNWDFIVHDALILCGNKINKNTFITRINDTKYCLESFINYNEDSTLNISVKEFYEFDNFEYFIKNIYNNSTNNDGIIFMPNNLPVISGTQYSMLKWKPKDKHTFDFLLREDNIGLKAFIFHMTKLELFANIHNKTEEGKRFIDKVYSLENYKDECIVECSFNIEKNNFDPLLIRTDKTHPNSLRTVERTLFNIKENIELHDFYF